MGPADAFSTGDPRLDNNRFFSERVEKAVDQQLASRGFEKRESGASDVLIHVHARIDQRIESDAIDRENARAATSPTAGRLSTRLARCSSISSYADQSTRLARLGRRGFDGAIDNQDWMEARIDDTVAKILARLPRDTSRNR